MINNINASFHDTNSAYSEQESKDTVDSDNKVAKLKDWWHETRIASSDNRAEQAIDDDFVDGLQWFDDDVQILQQRNQQPLVFNEVKPAVDWVVGTEKRTRIDWNVLPRTNDDRETAIVKTKLLKYLTDVNKAEFKRSSAFESAVKVGVGWLEIGIKNTTFEEPLFIRNESWRNIWVDHLSVENDLSDARFVCRSKVLDVEIAKIMYPEHGLSLDSAASAMETLDAQSDLDFYDTQSYYNDSISNGTTISVDNALDASRNRRKVVRLVEMWYKEPCKCQIFRMHGHQNNNQEYEETNESMLSNVELGHATLHDTIKMKVRMAVFIEGGVLLQDIDSPYSHNKFPFVPIWGYRRARDNQPYGIVRNARDPQMDLNKRRSKALFLLSVNRTIMDKGAIDDIDEYEEEVSRPDAIIEKNPGKELTIETNIQLAEEHLMLAQQDAEQIRNSSGVTGENLGHQTNATSGKAITARQNQGTVVTASLFDNARLSMQLAGEIMLSLIEQFYSDEKIIRITGSRGVEEFVEVNKYNQSTGEITNSITSSIADFKVSEQDYRESLRIAMFEQMMQMIGQLDSSISLNLLDLAFDFSDIQGKDEIVKRIRKINGQIDPDDSNAELLQQEADAANQQRQQYQEMIEKRRMEAEVRALEAKAIKEESMGDNEKMESVVKALQAALQILQVPGIAEPAQELMNGVPVTNTGAENKRMQEQAQNIMQEQLLRGN